MSAVGTCIETLVLLVLGLKISYANPAIAAMLAALVWPK